MDALIAVGSVALCSALVVLAAFAYLAVTHKKCILREDGTLDEILRTVGVADIFNFGESFLREAQGDDTSYGASKPLGTYEPSASHLQLTRRPPERYSAFISHTWHSSAWQKYLALCYEYNGGLAIFITHVAGFIFFLMQLFWRFGLGWSLPTYYQWLIPGTAGWHPDGADAAAAAFHNSPGPYAPLTGISALAGAISGLVCLFFGSHVRNRLGYDPRVFFDKCCIHQTDNEQRRKGIHALDKAIQSSDSVLVFADDAYFKRLWCVFELASFLHFHEQGKNTGTIEVKIHPISQGTFAVGMYVVVAFGVFAWTLACIFVEHHGLVDLTNTVQALVFYTVMAVPIWWLPKFYFCHSFLLQRRAMERQLATFSVRNAECAVEADRAIVEGKIKEWFGSLATFDQCVHGGVVRDGGPSRGLLGVLQAALGSEHSIDQMTVFFENSSALPWMMYDCMALATDWPSVLFALVFGLGEWLVFNPLYIHLSNLAARTLVDSKLPPHVKTAVRVVAIPVLGLWFYFLVWCLFNLHVVTSAIMMLVLGSLHYALRNVVYSNRKYMPVRVAGAANVVMRTKRWHWRAINALKNVIKPKAPKAEEKAE